MTLDSSRSLLLRLFILAFLVLVPPTAIMTYSSLAEFEQGMIPELDRKAAAVGRDIAAQVERAVGYGIPIDKLVGIDEFFTPVLASNPEIRYLAITNADGRVLFLKGAERAILEPHYRTADFDVASDGRKASIDQYLDLALPIAVKDVRVGQIHIGFGASYVRDRLMEILYDVGVVMAVSLLVAFEILLFVVFFNITGPMKLVGHVMDQVRRGDFSRTPGIVSHDEVGRFVRALNAAVRQVDDVYRRLMAYIDEVKTAHFDKQVVAKVADVEARVKFLYQFSASGSPQTMHERRATDIRLPLFLFVFAEELSRSFMPLYIKGLVQPFAGLSVEMAMAIPIAVFMGAIALATPYGGRVTDRLGSRRVFLIGMIPALLGYVMTGLALSVVDLSLWRAATGIGYAIVTMACQGYISKATKDESRTQGLGVFIGAVLTASVCGTAMGGILAERIGFEATFFVSAGLALLSGLLIYRLLGNTAEETPELREATRGEMLGLLRNWRFSALVLFAAIPSKMALTGFLFFLAPVSLWQAGYGLGDIARTLVAYPIAVVVLSPLVSRLADRTGWRSGLVAVGGLIGGLGLVAPALMPGIWPLVVGIVALGVSHGLSASPQLAMVPDVCWSECRSVGRTNVLAFVRLLERIGSVIGPLLAAAFVPAWGYSGAVVALGVVVLTMAIMFAVVSGAYGKKSVMEAEDAA